MSLAETNAHAAWVAQVKHSVCDSYLGGTVWNLSLDWAASKTTWVMDKQKFILASQGDGHSPVMRVTDWKPLRLLHSGWFEQKGVAALCPWNFY